MDGSSVCLSVSPLGYGAFIAARTWPLTPAGLHGPRDGVTPSPPPLTPTVSPNQFAKNVTFRTVTDTWRIEMTLFLRTRFPARSAGREQLTIKLNNQHV